MGTRGFRMLMAELLATGREAMTDRDREMIKRARAI